MDIAKGVSMNIIVNTFTKRQAANSRFSHFEGSWLHLAEETLASFANAKPGYRDGVMLVPVSPEGFFSGVRELNGGEPLFGKFESRREGEDPRKVIVTGSRDKMPAKSVDIVLYSSIVLAEDGSNELPAEEGNWEIISINANPFDEEMPISPEVLMHNHFGSTGGTATNLSDGEFVALLRKGFEFWKNKAMCG
tara:strand:+ start:318 stop:896 length:579 start_codon:yes stop_codon:yes gene_type:complete